MAKKSRVKYVILDRDGTLIEHVPYLSCPEQIKILPTVPEGIAKLQEVGLKLFLHTNQSGIGRGFFSLTDVVACHQKIHEILKQDKKLFEKICIAPETPDQPAVYRKPSPRFGFEIMLEYSCLAEEIIYIGDNITDLLTAKNLGSLGVGVNTGLENLHQLLAESDLKDQFLIFESFIDAVDYILRELV